MKRLAIFDLDGTLIDTIADLATATNHALTQFGYPTHTVDEYRFFVGNGINKLFERALPEGEKSQENILKIRAEFVPFYNIHNADLSRPYPGIHQMLSALQKAGMRLAVASNKYQEATVKLISQYFPDIRFTAVFGQREGVPTKPDPQVIEEIIRMADVNKSTTVYIGDSSVDMETGRNARVTTIGVSWGFRPRTELEAYHPDFIADCSNDILHFLQIEK